MNVGVLYICIGNYSLFWKPFYKSCERNFLKGSEYKKHYYVFTDKTRLYEEKAENVTVIYQEDLGWPGNTLYRFRMFLNKKTQLEKEDYLFFFNANVRFVKRCGEEFITCGKPLIMVKSPISYGMDKHTILYETNPKSTAYIATCEMTVYVAGGLNGGRSKEYLSMCEQLCFNVVKDDEKNIIAIHHDESHLNKYLFEHNDRVAVFEAECLYPELYILPIAKKAVLTDKNRYGGHERMRSNCKWKFPTIQYCKNFMKWKILLLIKGKK